MTNKKSRKIYSIFSSMDGIDWRPILIGDDGNYYRGGTRYNVDWLMFSRKVDAQNELRKIKKSRPIWLTYEKVRVRMFSLRAV